MSAAKLTIEQRRKIYCATHGHTPIRDYCFGYHHCARCGEMLGDSLGGAYRDDAAVYPSHLGKNIKGCNCAANAKKLTARDLNLVPPKFVKALKSARASKKAPRKNIRDLRTALSDDSAKAAIAALTGSTPQPRSKP